VAINGGTIFINVLANVGPFRQQMLGLGSAISKVGSTVSRVGVGLSRAVTLPLALAGAASVKLAVDYDAAFTRIDAITGASAKQIERWREQVLSLSGKTAQAPVDVANALYIAASAGLKASQIMPVLQQSAKGAAVGLGEVKDVAGLLTSTLNAYSKSGLTAAEVTDTLVAAVREGKAEPNEFATAIGRILPLASKAKVEFENVAASLASVSNIGLDVNEGVTAFRGLLKALLVPGTQAAETLKKIGLTSIEVRDQLAEEGLLGVIRTIEEETKQKFGKSWLEAINKIIPNIRALTGALGLTSQEAARVDAVFQKVAHSTGDADKAFQETAKGSQFQFQQALAKLKVAGIEIGNILIPILLDVVGYIEDAIKWFGNLSDSTKEFAVKAAIAAALLGPFLRILGILITLGGAVFKVITGITGAIKAFGAASAVAGAGEQLTLFGGAGAAGATAGAGPFVAAALAVAGALIAMKISADNAHEAIDQTVEDLRQGVKPAKDLTQSNAELTAKINTATEAQQNQGIASKFASVGINEARSAIEDNNEALRIWETGLVKVAKGAGLTAIEVDQFKHIMDSAAGTTEDQRHVIARLIGSYHVWGKSVDTATLNLVRDYLQLGLNNKAINTLNRAYHDATDKIKKHTEETQKNTKEAAAADHIQRLLAGGVKNAEEAVRKAGQAAGDASPKLKDVNDKLKDIGKQHPNPKVTVDGSAAQTTLQGLRTQLEELQRHDYIVDVYVKTHGSPSGFWVLEQLTKALVRITETPWSVDVLVKAGGPAGLALAEVSKMFTDAQHQLEKLGQVAADVWGADFPKAYKDDVAAFKSATQEKSKELTKLLSAAEKSLDKLKSKMGEFRDAIKSGFADAGSLISGALEGLAKVTEIDLGEGGTMSIPTPVDLASYLQEQIATSQAFAGKLAQLAASGLAPALLSQLASQGQESMPLIDALLAGGKDLIDQFNVANQTITQFANATANALSEEFFGGAIKRARNNLNELSGRIDRFNERISNQVENFVQALQTRRLGDGIENLIQTLNRSLTQLGVRIPHAAAGAIVRRPTVLLAGESGPEAIVPLDGSSGYGDVNVYVDVKGNAIYSRDLADEIRAILQKDKRYKRNLGLS